MTETEEAKSASRTPWIVTIVVLAVAVVSLATVGAVAWGTNEHHTSATRTAPPAWMQTACEQWSASYTGSNAPPSSWCASMGSWMTNQSPGTMMGPMMWGTPDQFRAACPNWSNGRADAQNWCDAMTGWMENRATRYGGWGPWMMRPSP